MEYIINFLRSDAGIISASISIIILIILYIINLIKLSRTKKDYKSFMIKIGNGSNLQESIEKYMQKIKEVENENQELKKYCGRLDKTISTCIQKIGIVRYSAFKDTGSDLSFTLALLNEENSGVVLNGIYSQEMSNIYAKPVEKGNSTYKLSEEEKQAINKAMNN